jgi:coenzyme F420-0:L-glutamate ligase / coenzyme F420-1:gamma-L-glutamate ligase
MPRSQDLRLIPIPIAGEVRPGDSLANLLIPVLQRRHIARGDILVVKHKIVSKAEGQLIDLETVQPSAAARAWARRHGLNARVVGVALAESKRIVRRKQGVLITATRHGFVCANSGVDVSNVDGGRHALLLPKDPDRSATQLHQALRRRLRLFIPVIISDSFGRPWREGLTEVAIGVAGMRPLHDYRANRDPHGYILRASLEAVADELACAAGLVCGKLNSTPACLIRGFRYQPGTAGARALIRSASKDLFR